MSAHCRSFLHTGLSAPGQFQAFNWLTTFFLGDYALLDERLRQFGRVWRLRFACLVGIFPVIIGFSVPCLGFEIPLSAKSSNATNAIGVSVFDVSNAPPNVAAVFRSVDQSESARESVFRIEGRFLSSTQNGFGLSNIEFDFPSTSCIWSGPIKDASSDLGNESIATSIVCDKKRNVGESFKANTSFGSVHPKKTSDDFWSMGGIELFSSQKDLLPNQPTTDCADCSQDASKQCQSASIVSYENGSPVLSYFGLGVSIGCAFWLCIMLWPKNKPYHYSGEKN